MKVKVVLHRQINIFINYLKHHHLSCLGQFILPMCYLSKHTHIKWLSEALLSLIQCSISAHNASSVGVF